MNLKKLTIGLVLLWILAQVILLWVYFDHRLVPDSKAYIDYALYSYAHGLSYPSQANLYNDFIFAPGLVMYLIGLLKLFGTVKIAMFLNILLNIGVVGNIFYIARYFFNRQAAYYSVILYCCLISNLFIPLHIITELPFLFFALSAFSLCLQGKTMSLVAAGLLFVLAQSVRPIVLVFIVAVVCFFIVRKADWKKYAVLFLSYFVFYTAYGIYNKTQCGHFVAASTTGGFNLMMVSHDKAWENVDYSVFNKGCVGYIDNPEKTDFIQRDSIWKARSVAWIKTHPVKYMELFFKKLPRMYTIDCWTLSSVLEINSIEDAWHSSNPKRSLLNRRIAQAVESIPYYITFVLFLLSVYKKRKEILSAKGILLLLFALGTIMTCLLPMDVRYHYPYIFVVTIWAGYYLASIKGKSCR